MSRTGPAALSLAAPWGMSGFCPGFHLDCRDQPSRDFRRPTTEHHMCRNIRTLFNFEPPATEDEVRASALQFVRKVSGFNSPSRANQTAFDRAVDDVATAARVLIDSLVTTADPRDREIEAERARAPSAARFGSA